MKNFIVILTLCFLSTQVSVAKSLLREIKIIGIENLHQSSGYFELNLLLNQASDFTLLTLYDDNGNEWDRHMAFDKRKIPFLFDSLLYPDGHYHFEVILVHGRKVRSHWFDLHIANHYPVNYSKEAVCGEKFFLQKRESWLHIPYCTNKPLYRYNEGIENIVFVHHGVNGDAQDYLKRLMTAELLEEDVYRQKTLMIAPQIFDDSNLQIFEIPMDLAYWTGGRSWGGKSSRDSVVRISSFTFLDYFLEEILSQRNLYPNLKNISFVGHSAGAQFVQRFAASSQWEKKIEDLTIQYIVMNPSSFLYLTPERYNFSSGCRKFNRWGYGLESLYWYPRQIGAEKIYRQYPRKRIHYVNGLLDKNPYDENLDRTCQAMTQGSHRLERALFFYKHLQSHFPHLNHTQNFVRDVGHSSSKMLKSEIVRKLLFRQ